jgi:hypothetical protein
MYFQASINGNVLGPNLQRMQLSAATLKIATGISAGRNARNNAATPSDTAPFRDGPVCLNSFPGFLNEVSAIV